MLFDTFSYVKMMRDVGFTEDQSETIVDVWSTVVKDQFVTKQDLKEAFLEERVITSKKFEELGSKINGNTFNIESLDSKLVALDTRVVALDTKLVALDTRVVALDTKVESLDTKIVSLATKLKLFEKNMTINFLAMQIATIGILAGVAVFLPKIWNFLG